MKLFVKLFLVLFMCINFSLCALASDYLPRYRDSIKNFGIGVYYAPQQTVLYSEPDEKSKVLNVIKWDDENVCSDNVLVKPKEVFITFIPSKKTALFVVQDETDNWCKVVYNQEEFLTGWIKKNESNSYNWLSFINTIGKKEGLYFWSDLTPEEKQLRTAPDDSACLREENGSYYFPKYVIPTIIRGNWMLTRLIDFNNSVHIGWLRWRTDDGKILLFPRLTKS